MDDAQLRTIWQQRQPPNDLSHLSEPIALLMKRTLGQRVRQLAELAAVWDEVVPQEIAEHTALESFSRGLLTVLVDSAPHRYQLQSLLGAGLLKAIQQRFRGAIRKIRAVPGQFYAIDLAGQRRYEV